MAIPSGGYDTATITNPTSALTDFTLIVDLSRMSTDWWSGVNTSDGTRGRASKDDGITELACDWIDFNDTAETGLLRVKWSGTLASSGAQVIRIYPPNTANTAYGVSDTYGQYNAYSSNWLGYWPLQSDATDRTSTQNNGTANGGITVGGTTGKIGNATSFDGIDDWIELSPFVDPSDPVFEVDLWYKGTDTQNQYFGHGTTLSTNPKILFMQQNSNYGTVGQLSMQVSNSDSIDGTWRNVGTTKTNAYIDSVSVASGDIGNQVGSFDNAGIGAFNRGGSLYQPTLGDIQDVKAFSTARSTEERTQEYSQTNDNATFWGTWTWNSAGGGFTLTADAGTFTATGQDSSLLFDRKVSAETGTFSTTGQDAGLFTARVLTADGGSYATVGQDANLTLGTNIILSAEAGTFSVTGQDASLIHNKIINGETGEFTLSGQPASLIWSGEDFYIQILTIGSEVQTGYNISSEIESTSIFTSNIQSTIQLEGKI